MAVDDKILQTWVLRDLLDSDFNGSSSLPKNTLTEVGLKVVRGPDWKWGDQDGGEGHVGTVVEIGRTNGALNNQLFVLWDNGFRGTYRIGYSNAYDLRTLDNASIGVCHPTVTCNSCRKNGVMGMRWKCKVCYDYDLCTRCYMSDKHDTTHPFIRFMTYNGDKVEVPKRQGSVKIAMRGIFASAKVVRGQDWIWNGQDGGILGTVIDVCGWDAKTDWTACHVMWSHKDSSDIYRLGHEGKMDLKYTEDAADGYYYRDHLPITGDEKRLVRPDITGNIQEEETFYTNSTSINTTENMATNIKEFGSIAGCIDLCNNLEDLYHSKQFCDFTITVQDREFRVHKAILVARSPVFASMFQHDMKEKMTGMVDIPDCNSTIFEDFLFYIYSGKLTKISSFNVISLYDVAEKYNVARLKQDCVYFMKENLSVDTVIDVITLAVQYTEKELLERATEFFMLNASEIILSVKWQNFVIEHPVRANELYIKAYRYGK